MESAGCASIFRGSVVWCDANRDRVCTGPHALPLEDMKFIMCSRHVKESRA